MKGEKYFQNEYTEIWIENGVLFSAYAKDLKVNLEIAKICVAERLKLCDGKSYPMMVYGANLRQMDKEAGKFLRSGDAIKGILAGAFVVDSQFDYLVMSFFVMIFNPQPAAKLFMDDKKALEWLQQHKANV